MFQSMLTTFDRVALTFLYALAIAPLLAVVATAGIY